MRRRYMTIHKAEDADKILVSRREWLRLTALAAAGTAITGTSSASARPEAALGDQPPGLDPNPYPVLALWLVMTTGFNDSTTFDANWKNANWDKTKIPEIIEGSQPSQLNYKPLKYLKLPKDENLAVLKYYAVQAQYSSVLR